MRLKEIIKEKVLELGFEDAGFTGVEPLDYYIREIDSRPREMYGWVQTERFNTEKRIWSGGKSNRPCRETDNIAAAFNFRQISDHQQSWGYEVGP
jgi:hypothetical protein